MGNGRRCKYHLRRFGNTNDLGSLHLDPRTVGDAFVAEIKTIFEPWQLAEYLATARQTEPFDPDIYEAALSQKWGTSLGVPDAGGLFK